MKHLCLVLLAICWAITMTACQRNVGIVIPGSDPTEPTEIRQEDPWEDAWGDVAYDLPQLKQLATTRTADQVWLDESLCHYQMQEDGHGLAVTVSPDGLVANGTMYTVMYETVDGGQHWDVLHENFSYAKGVSVLVYMGDVAVLASQASFSIHSSLMVSYDRGHTWEQTLTLADLVEYDVGEFAQLAPYVIDYDVQNGLITFCWKKDNEEDVLINQFDVHTQQFVAELDRAPEFH